MVTATATAQKLFHYRVISGSHREPIRDDKGNVVMDKKLNRPLAKMHRANDPDSCIVSSPDELDKKFVNKFERVYGTVGTPLEEDHPEVSAFPKMTVAALKAYAKDKGIDVEGISLKDEIIQTIREAIAE